MKKKLCALALVLLPLLFVGCAPKHIPAGAPGSIQGQWEDASGLTEYSFMEDGTMQLKALDMGTFKGTYSLKGNQLTISYKVVIKDFNETYEIKLEGDTLYLNEKEFTRKK